MPKPENGDIIWMDKWDGVIGEVVSYEDDVLTLKLSNRIFSYSNVQLFNPVDPEDIEILTAKGVLQCMARLFEQALLDLSENLSEGVAQEIRRYKL